MSELFSKTLAAALLGGAICASSVAQLPPPPPVPPLPDEIRPTIVEIAPPAVRVERVTVAPGPSYVWARGYWDWDGDSWAWVPGRWVAAPVAGARWIAPVYTRVSTGWRYVPAHWSSQRVVSTERTSRRRALGHVKAKGKGHSKGKGKGHQKYD